MDEIIELECLNHGELEQLAIGQYVINFNFNNGWTVENCGRLLFVDSEGKSFLYERIEAGNVYEFTKILGIRLKRMVIAINEYLELFMDDGSRFTMFAAKKGYESVLIQADDVNVTLY